MQAAADPLAPLEVEFGAPLEAYRKNVPTEVLEPMDKLVKDLEDELSTKKLFQSRSIPASLRQRVWSFLHEQQLPADQFVVHALPYEPDPDLSIPQHSGFLFEPPVPCGEAGRKRSNSSAAPSRNFNSYKSNKPFAVDGSKSSDGQQLYCITCPAHASAPHSQQQQQLPAGQQEQDEQQDGSAGQQKQQQVATYRGYVRMFVGEQKPEDANGHVWQKVELKDGATGWLDTSVALGVWEPMTPHKAGSQAKRQKTHNRSGNLSSDGSTALTDAQQQLLLQGHDSDSAATAPTAAAAAAAAAGGVCVGSFDVLPATSAAATAGLLSTGAPALPLWALQSCNAAAAAAGGVTGGSPTDLGRRCSLLAAMDATAAAAEAALTAAAEADAAAQVPPPRAAAVAGMNWAAMHHQQQQHQQQQQQQQQHWASMFPTQQLGGSLGHAQAPHQQLVYTPAPPVPASLAAAAAAAVTAPVSAPAATSVPSPPAAAAGAPASVPAAAAAAVAMDALSLQLGNLQLEQRRKRLAGALIQACRTGNDLLECFGAGAAATALVVRHSQLQQQQHNQQQQQQQQGCEPGRQQQLVQLLADPGFSVVDQYGRNLLHLVATHSLKVPHQQRMQQLELLLTSDTGVADMLLCGLNNNGSTPLMVAACGIRREQDARVFRRLLRAAVASCNVGALATPTQSGWTVLHRLAHEAATAQEDPAAAAASGPSQQRVQLLRGLLHEYVQAVQQVAASLKSQAAVTAAGRFEEVCLRSVEPSTRHYKGHRCMQQLALAC